MGFPGGSAGKESACNAGDLGSILALGRSPGEGKGCPLQDSGLENSMSILRGHKHPTGLRDSHIHFQGKMRLFRVVVKQGLLCDLQITKTPGFGGFFF